MKIVTLLFLSIFYSFSLIAQDVSEVFTSSKATMEFVGLDFSEVRMVGSEGFSDPSKIQSYYFGVWNGLFMSEMDKYDVRGAFMKKEMDYDLSVVEEGNDGVDYINMVTNKNPKFFSEEKIQGMVKKYNTEAMTAKFGLSFIVHSFNKFQEMGYFYVVIFDSKSKKVLLSERLSGEAGGFGFRNYWARSYYNVIKTIQESKFRKWKREINSK
ncbi:MAG: hypothetical protein MK207_07900 [Saprospiraceae bacterium]|nr:hypothetical protein [Saprospiraceae bacterium]